MAFLLVPPIEVRTRVLNCVPFLKALSGNTHVGGRSYTMFSIVFARSAIPMVLYFAIWLTVPGQPFDCWSD